MAVIGRSLKAVNNFIQISMNVRFISSKSLTYSDYGDPIKVIAPVEYEISKPKKYEVVVKMIAAPVNPADINMIEGKYPIKPALPGIAGNEGVGEVIEVGNSVNCLLVGDKVVPGKSGLGTWRTFGVFSEADLIKVPKDLGTPEAATFTVNPCTAYRMLKDFRQLKPEDTVIQNGANSACGQNVIQICKAWGINTVNVVRNRPEIVELKDYLTNLGATYVLTEEEIRTTDIFKTKQLLRPSLALNCVGGKSALEILRQLSHSGVLVTYGGMSRDPLTIPTSALIFKNLTTCGFWMTQWIQDNSSNPLRKQMYDDLFELMITQKLHAPAHKYIKFDQYRDAIMNTLSIQGFTGKKYILDFEKY